MCYFNHKSNLTYDFTFKNKLNLAPHGDPHIGPSNYSAIDFCIVVENDSILFFSKMFFITSNYFVQVTLDQFIPESLQTKFIYRNINDIKLNLH